MDDPNPAIREEALKYKLRKEAFVSNLSGSSLTDINIVTLVAASAILLWTVLHKRGFLETSDTVVIYAIDFLLNVCAILFAFTAYASVPSFLNLALVVPAVLLLLPLQQKERARRDKAKGNLNGASTTGTKPATRDSSTESNSDAGLKPGTLITRPFLTNYRGAMLIATFLAILAVDFHVFPRRFAKVETWGTSLMDLGVGSFVFSAGIVGARAVIREEQNTTQRGVDLVGRLVGALKHATPLFILGLVRLVSVKNLEYAEHVTEYGVHWNFFFTLGLLPPFVEAVDCCFALLRSSRTAKPVAESRSIRYDVVALLITVVYELVLNNTSLSSFILIAPRTPTSSLINKNREGVFSFFGYLSIFLSGRSTGILVCQWQLTNTKLTTKKGTSSAEAEQQHVVVERSKIILPQLVFRSLAYVVLYLISTNVYAANLTVSRRLANSPYVLWIIAYNNAQLFLYALIEAVGPAFTFKEKEGAISAATMASPIMKAFNQNGLVLFLVANLGTGVVNLTLNTLDTRHGTAMCILLLYAAIVSFIAVGMANSGLKVKI